MKRNLLNMDKEVNKFPLNFFGLFGEAPRPWLPAGGRSPLRAGRAGTGQGILQHFRKWIREIGSFLSTLIGSQKTEHRWSNLHNRQTEALPYNSKQADFTAGEIRKIFLISI